MNGYVFDASIREGDDVSTGIGLACRFKSYLTNIVDDQLPHYKDVFPFLRGLYSKVLFCEDYMIFTVSYGIHMTAIMTSSLNDDELNTKVLQCLGDNEFFTYAQMKSALGQEYLKPDTFTFFSKVADGKISCAHFIDCVVDWLNAEVLPVVLENNRRRVLDAIPEPPNFDISSIKNRVFVLDDCSDNVDDLGKQGTAFYLNGVGFVTCYHVLTDEMQLFCSDSPHKRYNISIRKKNMDIDIAIFDVDGLEPDGFEIGSSDELSVMDHIAVIGYPKYQMGDNGFLTPGLITGFRIKSAIRRIVVNASIVAGGSGGPVIDASNKVIGIAVKGFSGGDIEPINEVIPIDAIQFLS